MYGYFLDSAFVAAAFEVSCEEGVDDLEGQFGRNEPGGKYEHIRIVVLSGECCEFGGPAEGCADTLMFVQGHGDAITGAAHGDAGEAHAVFHRFGARVGEIGIVAGIRTISSEILEGDIICFEIAFDKAFEFIAGVVAAQRYGFFVNEY